MSASDSRPVVLIAEDAKTTAAILSAMLHGLVTRSCWRRMASSACPCAARIIPISSSSISCCPRSTACSVEVSHAYDGMTEFV